MKTVFSISSGATTTFVCGGENIFPVEVEALLERHPAVHQALVMPFDHEMKGQVPYALRRAARGRASR
jgi:long-chain acyl-CoA synthetase